MIVPNDLLILARRAHDAEEIELSQVLRTVAHAYRQRRLGVVLQRLGAAGGRPHRDRPPQRPTGRRPGRPGKKIVS